MVTRHALNVGYRYVFFESLLINNPGFPDYPQVAAQGTSYVNQATAILKGKSIENDTSVEGAAKIKAYIDYIHQLAENELNSEQLFMNEFKEIINNAKDQNGEDLFSQEFKSTMIQNINPETEINQIEYDNFLVTLQYIMNQSSALASQRRKNAQESARFVDSLIQGADESLQERLKEALHTGNYGEYASILDRIKPKGEEYANYGIRFTEPLSRTISTYMNKVLQTIVDDPKLKDEVFKALCQRQGNIQQLFSAALFEHVRNLDYMTLIDQETIQKTAKDFADNYITRYLSQLNDEYIAALSTNISKVQVPSMEEIVLGGLKKKGKQYRAETFLTYNEEGRQDIYNRYANKFDDQFIRQLENAIYNNNFNTGIKKQFSSRIGQAIVDEARRQGLRFGKNDHGYRYNHATFVEESTTELYQNFINNPEIRARLDPKNLKNQLQITVEGSAVAEDIVAAELSQLTKEQLSMVAMGGKNIKAKADVIITLGLEDFDFRKINIFDNNIAQQLNEKARNFGKEFLNAIGSKVDANLKIEKYEQVLGDLYNSVKQEVDKVYDDDSMRKEYFNKAIQELNKLIVTGVSVKDYVWGSSLGFEGGSLGANLEAIISNIDKMYNIGGIDRADKELLYFVAANSGPDGIARGLKDDLAHYLLGGAMMILFDDGFTAASNYMEKIQNQFQFQPKTMHLFNVNGHYVPASLVYSSVYNQLIVIYSDIVGAMEHITSVSANITNTISISNNITEENDKPSFQIVPSAQTRWDTVANKAADKEKVNVNITFLAGILDLFRQIPEAFGYN